MSNSCQHWNMIQYWNTSKYDTQGQLSAGHVLIVYHAVRVVHNHAVWFRYQLSSVGLPRVASAVLIFRRRIPASPKRPPFAVESAGKKCSISARKDEQPGTREPQTENMKKDLRRIPSRRLDRPRIYTKSRKSNWTGFSDGA